MRLEEKIRLGAELIHQSRRMAAFTGAGHSTPSGIPDFRSPHSGLWERYDPMLVASIWSFRINPHNFYDWIRPMVDTMSNAEPNAAHNALADLEQLGHLKVVITQNIDDLHQRAGSGRVLELHGHLREATCIRCYKKAPIDRALQQRIRDGHVPQCECGGVMKPDVILFGEQLPIQVLNQAMDEARHCDLILVAGSSLEVTPAADIPFLAVDSGAKAIMVNLESTAFDSLADVVIHGDVAEILPRLVETVSAMDGR
jgi:NAD-dependent deacetylase